MKAIKKDHSEMGIQGLKSNIVNKHPHPRWTAHPWEDNYNLKRFSPRREGSKPHNEPPQTRGHAAGR